MRLHNNDSAKSVAGRRVSVTKGRVLAIRSAFTFGIFALTLSACDTFDRLLSVSTPSRLAEENYLVPSNALLISNSAVADFECALGAYIVASGLAGGEFIETTQTASRWDYDRRSIAPVLAEYSTSGCAGIGTYTPLNVARHTNDQAVRVIEGWTDEQVANRQRLIARNSAMAGYALVLLGEGFCEATINVGPILTSAVVFDSAEVRFTKAIAAAQASSETAILNLALVGRARARLNKGDAAGAAADAALVPQDFVFNATADLNAVGRNNRIFVQNNQNFGVSVGVEYRAMTVDGAPDPRVRVVDAGRNGSDQTTRSWVQQKYPAQASPTPIATGIEAKLILAEASGAGQGVAIINTLRARAGIALPPLTASEQAAFSQTIAEERRRELFLQGNRWFDVRRLNLTQTPAVGAVYPKAGFYGDQRCWPLPDAERFANPNA